MRYAVRSLLGLGSLAWLAACDDAKPAPTAPSRVAAVQTSKAQASTSDLCDALYPAAEAPTLTFPPVEPAAPASSGGWRWINVWASWCSPCVEEMPLIAELARKLSEGGHPIDVALLSVDQSAEAMQGFIEKHPEAQGSVRLGEPEALAPWLLSVGLDEGATLPIHLFVDPAGKVRCTRTGAVRERDLALIEQLISG